MHGKLYFFGDYEDTQQQRYDGSNYFVVPTTAERTGDFSADAFTIYDPTQPDNADGTRQAFAGNKIILPPTRPPSNFFPRCPNAISAPTATRPLTTLPSTSFSLESIRTMRANSMFASTGSRAQSSASSAASLSTACLLSTFNAFGNMWDLNYAQNVTNGRNVLSPTTTP